MYLPWLLSALHLISLALGFGSCWMRAAALRSATQLADLKAVFRYDNLYGLATLLWISTGLWRAFGGQAKGTDYYLNSQLFWLKMGLFGLVFACELYPMVMLIKWRKQSKKGIAVDFAHAPKMANLSYLELVGLLLMVFIATAMARGMG
jgi:putative membrane protein